MSSDHIIFSQRQTAYIVLMPTLIITILMVTFAGISFSHESESALLYSSVGILMILLFLLYYRFDIIVTKTTLKLSFGIGVIKKEIPLSAIDFDSFSEKKIPWQKGAGWRNDFKGNVLFNASSGTALTFKINSKHKHKYKRKTVMIVTKERQALKQALQQQAD